MPLKIVRARSAAEAIRNVKVTAPKVSAPASAREIQFRCSACGKHAYVALPFDPTPLQRQQIIKASLDEHRQVCTAGAAADGREYEMTYRRL